MEIIDRILVNTYLNNPDTIPSVMNTIVLMIHYGMLLLIKMLLNDRTVYFINTWEQMKYMIVHLILMTLINYFQIFLLKKYYRILNEREVNVLIYIKSRILQVEAAEKRTDQLIGKRKIVEYEGNQYEELNNEYDRRNTALLQIYNALEL